MLSEIELMCDRIAVIQNGKLIDMREVQIRRNLIIISRRLRSTPWKVYYQAEGFTVEPLNDGFIINAEKAQIPALIQQFTAQELQLFAVNPHRKTLEDQFLEMTGGGQIAEAHTK